MSQQNLEETAYWVAFSRISGLGAARLQILQRRFGTLSEAWQANDNEIASSGLPQSVIEEVLSARHRLSPEAELLLLEKKGVSAIPLGSTAYPENLRQIPSPPAVLYILGSLLPVDAVALAIVGTRRPTRYGLEATHRLTTDLTRAGITIISGLALGIDAAAHQAALESGGRTIAVLGSGVDVVYPSSHKKLAERITENGALISEYPIGTRPDARFFPVRNRIISGLSKGVLVIEAGERSGALITAQFALDQNRDTFAIPGSIFAPMSKGTNKLIMESAAKLITSAADIIEDMNLPLQTQQIENRKQLAAAGAEKQVLACLSQEPAHLDEIARTSGLTIPAVSSALVMLELKGLARQVGSMHYVLA